MYFSLVLRNTIWYCCLSIMVYHLWFVACCCFIFLPFYVCHIGLYVTSKLIMRTSTIRSNKAVYLGGFGGGLYLGGDGSQISNTVFSANRVGGIYFTSYVFLLLHNLVYVYELHLFLLLLAITGLYVKIINPASGNATSLSNCTFRDNLYGGAHYDVNSGVHIIANSLFYANINNNTNSGGGVYLLYACLAASCLCAC